MDGYYPMPADFAEVYDRVRYQHLQVGVSTDSVSPAWTPQIEVQCSLGPWNIVKPKPIPRLAGRAWLRPSKRRGK